ncbi:MAG: DUF3784 domain-containing protein [Clostridiales bacterium]|nr:DUF3784 domain-containing protein [Clostridiales bacterium]
MVGIIIFSALAILCFVISVMHFCGKGFLFNNAYIYASKYERERMNKKPYYIQSGVIFLLIGIVFAINALDAWLMTNWLFYGVVIVVLGALVYAVVSSIIIDKNQYK